MAVYTTTLKDICEALADLHEPTGFEDIDQIIQKAVKKIFDWDTKIDGFGDSAGDGVLFNFDDYGKNFKHKFIRHFYTREICCETYGLWKLRLRTRLNEIMPYYNQLLESAKLKFNPLEDIDIYTEKDGYNNSDSETANNGAFHNIENSNSSRSGKSNTSNITTASGEINSESNTDMSQSVKNNQDADSWDMYSDTPQGGINGVANNSYLSNARHNTANNDTTENTNGESNTTNNQTSIDNSNSNTNTTDNEEHTTQKKTDGENSSMILTHARGLENVKEHTHGKNGGTSYSKMLLEYRETILNIDRMILNDCECLFMQIW